MNPARVQTDIYKDRSSSLKAGSLCGHDNSSKTGNLSGSTISQAPINRVVPLATSIEDVKQSYHQMVEISVEAKEELGWWI